MVFYLTTDVRRSGPDAPALASLVAPRAYARVLDARRLRAGTYVFGDLEGLAPADAASAAVLWNVLVAAGGAVRALNHPTAAMRSYELLRRRHERGLGDGDAIRLDEARRPARYPVAVRDAAGGGWLSAGIATAAELDHVLAGLVRCGIDRRRAMLVERAEPAEARAALVVGERVLPLDGAGALADALAATLRDACRDARVDVGRVEYGLWEGRVQVWGIATDLFPASPRAGSARGPEPIAPCGAGVPDAQALAAALRALDAGRPAAGAAWVATGRARRRRAPAALRRLGERLRERVKEASDRLPRW